MSTSAARGIFTFCSISSAAACIWARFMSVWKRRVSSICVSMVYMGSSAVIGSWKIMDISLPRILRISALEMAVSSVSEPSARWKRMELPLPTDSGNDRSPISVEQVMLLPQPDSPTTPKVCFLRILRSMPSTSFTGGCFLPLKRSMERLRISKRCSKLRPSSHFQLGIEHIAQRIAKDIENQYGHDDEQQREQRHPRRARHIRAGLGKH